jgi:hypothetical protein
VKRHYLTIVLAILTSLTTLLSAQPTESTPAQSRAVDVVICLDTSGSMEDLLDSARARLWDVVNELAKMKPTPLLRVGLLSFGSDKSTSDKGWIINHLDLTNDLDAVYAELAALTIGGSEEYIGRVLDTALDEMSWTSEWNALRIIFVAGNESADQGVEDHDFRITARAARDNDIIINALYAGSREQGRLEHWHKVAQQGAGNFSAIDPVTGTIQIATPQDQRLLDLNGELNGTYLPYGKHGENGLSNQIAQDSNATRLGVQSCSSRIVAKGTALYTNAAWDLVDRVLEDDFRWESLYDEDLPEAMRAMTVEGRQAFVNAKRTERETLQLKIQKLSEDRETYIKSALAEAGSTGLGEAMRQTIREQAMAKGFTCDGC